MALAPQMASVARDRSSGRIGVRVSDALVPSRAADGRRRTIKSHAADQTRPRPPSSRKAERQPVAAASGASTSGATMAPILVEALEMPMAAGRSFSSNRAETVLMAIGVPRASVAPNAIRAAPN